MSEPTSEIISYYTNLLILQYKGKPKAAATISALVTMLLMSQLPNQVMEGFTLGSAQGVQLDIIGKYAGVKRSGIGFSGPITLNDADFTKLVTMAILVNNLGSSLYDIQAFLKQYFPGTILVYDYQNMHMSYFMDSSVGSLALAELFIVEDLLPRPMGVQLASLIFAPDISHFFSMRTYALPIYNGEPFNDYASYQVSWPWLSYTNSVQ